MGGGTVTGGGRADPAGGMGGGGGCCWPRVGTAVTSIGGGTDMATAVTGGPNLLTRPEDVGGAASPLALVVGEAVPPPPSFLSQGILPTRGGTFLPLAAAESLAALMLFTPWPQAIATEGREPYKCKLNRAINIPVLFHIWTPRKFSPLNILLSMNGPLLSLGFYGFND